MKKNQTYEERIISVIRNMPYFIAVSKGNDWDEIFAIDKNKIIFLLGKYKWDYFLESSYIESEIYTVVINFLDIDYQTTIKDLSSEDDDYIRKIGIYINKNDYSIICSS